MCKSRTTPRDWFKCTRPEHPAHWGVMLCTVQCRPASACARKSPPRGCTLKKQDKTRQGKLPGRLIYFNHGPVVRHRPHHPTHTAHKLIATPFLIQHKHRPTSGTLPSLARPAPPSNHHHQHHGRPPCACCHDDTRTPPWSLRPRSRGLLLECQCPALPPREDGTHRADGRRVCLGQAR